MPSDCLPSCLATSAVKNFVLKEILREYYVSFHALSLCSRVSLSCGQSRNFQKFFAQDKLLTTWQSRHFFLLFMTLTVDQADWQKTLII
jgi:hypothetical protein